MRLQGKVAVVTGAAQGIVRVVSLAFAKEGANVIVTDINFESAEKVSNEIKSLGCQAQAIRVDVSKHDDVSQMVEQAIKCFGRIDILVNNAAPTGRTSIPIIETTEDVWDKHIDVGLKGTFLCSQAVGKEMIKQKYGKIVNIASTLGSTAIPGMVSYSTSKAGILQLTRAFGVEWGKYNINVNAVSPGTTKTSQFEYINKLKPSQHAGTLKRLPLKRFNQPEDIANTVIFLASSEADNITCQEIVVDSGISALAPEYVWPEEQ